MANSDSFLHHSLSEGIGRTLQSWEQTSVIVGLLVHLIDVGLDLIVILAFFGNLDWPFFLGTSAIVLGAWIVSGLYVSFGSAGNSSNNDEGTDRLQRFALNFTQVQIFTEAYRCVFVGGETDYFHTLRLLEALLEAAPSALLQLIALVLEAGDESSTPSMVRLLQCSVISSLISVGLGLAMWEQKVQMFAPCRYVFGVAVLRSLEVASRTMTLALFAVATHPHGLPVVLVVDYIVMVLIISRHKSVHLTYGFFVAIPLVLVSLEPFVWRRQDHAVPKDIYYTVRAIEIAALWVVILSNRSLMRVDTFEVWSSLEVLAVLVTSGLFCLLPFVWRAARHQELSQELEDWDDERGDDFSGSEGSRESAEEAMALVQAAAKAEEQEQESEQNLPPE
mmetsp:Transcript_90468/g.198173  ORF Transcript_90468/g.198173 Transcript_90468/m.198173 type:complete len:392 (-) Transcript_90468:25-1200(-)